MICKNCGRPLTNKICDYCGTDYRTEEERKALECNHIYDSVMYEDFSMDRTPKLLFKCQKCKRIVTIPLTIDFFHSIIGR